MDLPPKQNNQSVTFTASYKKVLIAFLAFVLILGTIFSFSLKKTSSPDLEGFLFGAATGAVFGLVVLFFRFGQRVKIFNNQVEYSPHLLSIFISKLSKRLVIPEVKEVALGLPKINQEATFAAINIRTDNQEITFNPDLFDEITLQKLFAKLQQLNPNILFDSYATRIIKGESGDKVFRIKVFGNFSRTILLMFFIALLSIGLYKTKLLSKQMTFVFLGVALFVLPFVFNYLMKKLGKS